MIRRILDFVFILLFVWVCMLGGLWLISEVIVPMEIPGFNGRMVGVFQVLISATMVLIWLLIWRWLARTMFWRAI